MYKTSNCSKKIEKQSLAGYGRHTKNILLKSMFLKYKGSKLPQKNRPNIRVRAIKYQLRSLVVKTETFPKYFGTIITYMNYCFPTDVRFHPSNFGSKKSHFSQFYCQIAQNRISKIEYCHRKQTWSYQLEERCPSSSHSPNTPHPATYLQSLAHPDATTLSLLLEKWFDDPKFPPSPQASPDPSLDTKTDSIGLPNHAPQFPTQNPQNSPQFHTQNFFPINLPTKNFLEPKIAVIEEPNWGEIKKNAYICMVEEYGYTESNRYKVCAFKHNKLLLELIGRSGIKIGSPLNGFQVLKHIVSGNWITYLKEVIRFKLDPGRNGVSLSEESLYLLDSGQKEIKREVKMFKKVYKDGNKIFLKIWTVFISG
jgi:hypothetical protein